MRINRQDTNGVKSLLQVGELGYDNYPAGGDAGRVYVGNGTSNIAQAKKSEVVTVDGKVDTHVARIDNPHGVTKTQVGLGNVDNTADTTKVVASAGKWTTSRLINGTAVDGTVDITTSQWGTSRNITIGDTTKSVNGSADISWSLNEVGAIGTASPAFTGVPTAPTASVGTSNTVIATTAFVNAEIANDTYSKAEIDTLDSTTVKLTGTQTITGVKTFSDNIMGNITGNAAGNSGTTTKLYTPVTINGVSFDGSANITVEDSTKVALAAFTGANQSLTGNGYQKLAGGLIIQWGSGFTDGTGFFLTNLPISFPNGHFIGVATAGQEGSYVTPVTNLISTQIGVVGYSSTNAAVAVGLRVTWIAIGN